MKKESRNQMKKAIEFIKEWVESIHKNTDNYSLDDKIRISKGLMLGDVLVTAYGIVEDEVEFLRYKITHDLDEEEVDQPVTEGFIYGIIKEVEFSLDYLKQEETQTADTEETIQTLEILLELVSGIFINWDEMEQILSEHKKVSIELNTPEEYTYEELINNGETPNYQEPRLTEDNAPQTRAERRRRRRR